MTPELENKLVINYPKILEELGSGGGICVRDGWYKIIENLCNTLQKDIDKNNKPQITAIQIKEKFGTLRFYVDEATLEQYEIIRQTENLSQNVCEICGTSENVTTKGKAWIETLCDKCRGENK